jgi:hypothetical protein
MNVPVERIHGLEKAARLVIRAQKLRNRWRSWVHRKLLAHPRLIPVGFGLLASCCVVSMGILTLPMHAGFPFWLHGCIISLSTGVLIGGMAHWLVRELRYQAEIRRIRLEAAELISHEICNSLQVLMQRDYVDPTDRDQCVNEAIERIRTAVREILPSFSDIRPSDRPTTLKVMGAKKRSAGCG